MFHGERLMADLQFPNLGNALLAGAQAAYSLRRGQREADEEQRRLAAQQYIEPALKGDQAAFGKLAANAPGTAASIVAMLGRLDTNERAKVKDAADFTAHAANAVLQANPADRPAIYKQMYDQGIALGHKMTGLPATYDATVDPMLRSHREMAVPILERLKLENGPTQIDLPGPGGAAPTGSVRAAPNRDQFVATMMPHALEVSKATGLDPRLVIAQSALETGYGAAAPGNNFFGIKSHGQAGGQMLGTTEVGPGGAYQTQDSFRTYADPGASAQDYANFLKTNGRYGPVLAAKGLDAQIEAMGKSGYATDPNYAAKLRQIAQTIPVGGPANGPPTPLMPAQAGAIPPGTIAAPPQIAQGDTPQADGSGTPLPPNAPAKPQGPIWDTDPRPHGFVMRGNRDKYGNVTPIEVGGALLFRNPQTGEHVLYKPAAPIPFGWQRGADGRLAPEPGGPQDPETIKTAAEAKRKAENGETGPFPGQSVEANALNMLIRDGTLTQNQAAQLAAGKTITNPADGSVMFMTPSGLFGKPLNGPAVPIAPAPSSPPMTGAASASAAPGTPPGMIPITPPKPVSMTEGQANAATYADRMQKSGAIIDQYEKAGLSAQGKALEKVPFGVGNYLQKDEYQLYEQARRDFINATLRRESGAVISPSEFENADVQYFPRPGDSEAVLKQKAENRRTTAAGIARAAGPAYKPGETTQPGGGNSAKLLDDARQAIAKGAPREKVIERLRSMGVKDEP